MKKLQEMSKRTYEWLEGLLELEESSPEVQRFFQGRSADFDLCGESHQAIYEARERLLDKLHAEEDTDLEIILVEFYHISRKMCERAFHFGAEYAAGQCTKLTAAED